MASTGRPGRWRDINKFLVERKRTLCKKSWELATGLQLRGEPARVAVLTKIRGQWEVYMSQEDGWPVDFANISDVRVLQSKDFQLPTQRDKFIGDELESDEAEVEGQSGKASLLERSDSLGQDPGLSRKRSRRITIDDFAGRAVHTLDSDDEDTPVNKRTFTTATANGAQRNRPQQAAAKESAAGYLSPASSAHNHQDRFPYTVDPRDLTSMVAPTTPPNRRGWQPRLPEFEASAIFSS
ncbi:hypothetical protein LTR53_005108 [Teratosphaeriaceae sp. CCFEE 6253]|nr:hypothetical protein LTR53_005108 [Teratosphaeriaceae sp. CCFEE 6253]